MNGISWATIVYLLLTLVYTCRTGFIDCQNLLYPKFCDGVDCEFDFSSVKGNHYAMGLNIHYIITIARI